MSKTGISINYETECRKIFLVIVSIRLGDDGTSMTASRPCDGAGRPNLS